MQSTQSTQSTQTAPKPTSLPEPSKKHAICAWCRTSFAGIVELIDHVDVGHTPCGPIDRAVRPAA